MIHARLKQLSQVSKKVTAQAMFDDLSFEVKILSSVQMRSSVSEAITHI